MGGAQAIAALGLGTETVAPVDVIVGPGNRYVQEAKRQVVGLMVGFVLFVVYPAIERIITTLGVWVRLRGADVTGAWLSEPDDGLPEPGRS